MTRATTKPRRSRQGTLRLRRVAGRAEAARREAVTRSNSASASPPSPRCAVCPSRVLGRCPMEPVAGSRRRSGCSRPARWRSSPARARTARATRRRGARSWPTGSVSLRRRRGPPWRHRDRLQGPRHLRLTQPRRRRRGRGPGRGQGHREGQAVCGAPARSERRRPRVQGRPVCRQGHRQGVGITEVALATFASHNYPDHLERASTPTRPTTR